LFALGLKLNFGQHGFRQPANLSWIKNHAAILFHHVAPILAIRVDKTIGYRVACDWTKIDPLWRAPHRRLKLNSLQEFTLRIRGGYATVVYCGFYRIYGRGASSQP